MRRQIFATAVSIALLFGAAAPALAGPGKGKVKDGRVNGGGVIDGAEFSVQARSVYPAKKKGTKGHFNYTKAATATSPAVKIRCKNVTFTPAAGEVAGDKAGTVSGSCTQGSKDDPTTPVTATSVTAVFYDNPAGDRASIAFGGAAQPASSPIEGSIHVR